MKSQDLAADGSGKSVSVGGDVVGVVTTSTTDTGPTGDHTVDPSGEVGVVRVPCMEKEGIESEGGAEDRGVVSVASTSPDDMPPLTADETGGVGVSGRERGVLPETGEERDVSEASETQMPPKRAPLPLKTREGGESDVSKAEKPSEARDKEEVQMNVEEMMESAILKRMELSSMETSQKLEQLTQLIGALQVAPDTIPPEAPMVEPMSESRVEESASAPPVVVGDSIARAALVGGMMEAGNEEGEVSYLEACQPSNSACVDDTVVVVAGEIVSGEGVARELEGVGAVDEGKVLTAPSPVSSAPEAEIGTTPVVATPTKGVAKRPKLQLAASFTK